MNFAQLKIIIEFYWRKFVDYILGRERFIGYDISKSPDKSCIISGYRDRNGIVHIEHETWKETEG